MYNLARFLFKYYIINLGGVGSKSVMILVILKASKLDDVILERSLRRNNHFIEQDQNQLLEKKTNKVDSDTYWKALYKKISF